ncbi:MAG TPA: hypothetical protein VMT35_07480, partial [Ignavibacteriaceae bacterium]|nr:hypothetical protein [Ignavibacteriaceae bacterium]
DLTVGCTECHSRENSRLAGLKDFYMPGRDYSSIIETSGISIIIFTIAGVFTHGTIRVFSSRKKKKEDKNAE